MRILVNLLLISLSLLTTTAFAKNLNFDLAAATPVGSWQERQETTVDHKGRKQVSVMRSSLLSEEMRDGKKHYWMEVAIESFNVSKSGKRKKEGDKVILKALVDASFFANDPANVLNNVRGFGSEIIMQSGKERPMRITGGGGLMSGMMQAMGTEVNYDFKELGKEQVSVEAGDFTATKVQGTGSSETKIVFKKIRVESDSTVWLSDQVPFGLVKAEGTSKTNGKESTHSSELLAYGRSGAKSQITGEPQDLPNLGNIFGQ